MAQSGYSPIILFHSTASGNTPTTANLAVGELAINVADGKLFYTDGSTVSYIASAAAAPTVTPSVDVTGSTPPSNGVFLPAANTLAFTTNSNTVLQFNQYGIGSIYAALIETANISATSATGTISFYADAESVLYYTSAASGNFTLDFVTNGSTPLSASLSPGQSMSLTFLNTNGATAYYCTGITIDGVAQSVKWQGGAAPINGNANSIDAYTFAIICTGAGVYTVLGNQTQFS